MAYLDNLLASGEQPLRREHQHWFVLAASARYAILAWIVAIVLLFVSGGISNDAFRQVIGFVVLMRYVLKGNPQAGLPLLNGGALLGFLLSSLLVYGTVHIV